MVQMLVVAWSPKCLRIPCLSCTTSHRLSHLELKGARDPQCCDKPVWEDYQVGALDSQLQSSLTVVKISPRVPSRRQIDEIQRLFQDGHLDKALDGMLCLDEQGTVPSIDLYRSLLKACSRRKSLAHAKRVHAHLANRGLQDTKFLGECVVSTLVQCGGLTDAVQLFQKLSHRTVLSWTAVISGYARAGLLYDALRLYDSMREEGLEPNKYTFVSLIKACSAESDLKEGKHIHAEVVRYSLQTDLFVGTALVDMYAKCGSIVDAQHVFDGLFQRDVVAWNAMLAAYTLQGQAEKALDMYGRMVEAGVIPDDRTFVNALQACTKLAGEEQDVLAKGELRKVKCLQTISHLHADARKRGCELDVFVASSLINLYSRCGSLVDAQNLFDRLPVRDVVIWTAMISGYVQQGQPEEALDLYRQMLKARVSPSSRTVVSALQACSLVAEKEDVQKSKYLQDGKAIHIDAWKKGYKSDVFIGSVLLSMYGKFGSIADAKNVFDELSHRDVVSWNAIIMAYMQQGHPGKALLLYEQMQEDAVSPNDRTIVIALQACGLLAEAEEDDSVHGQLKKIDSLDKGKAMHSEAWRRGYSSDLFVVNTLISMYGKCGSIADAQNVFDGLSNPNVVSWNSIIAAYSQQAETEKTLEIYEQMMEEGGIPDVRTFVSVLQACGKPADNEENAKAKSLEKGRAIHAETWRRGYYPDVFVGNTLIGMYGKCGSSVADAQNVFTGLLQPDLVSWNAMLTACIEHSEAEKAWEFYVQMEETGVRPDVRTFVRMLQACGMLAEKESKVNVDGRLVTLKSLIKGKALHAEAWKNGFKSDVFVNSALLIMYGKCGCIVDAQSVFDELSQQDVVSWTAMLAAYVQLGEQEKALQLYRRMQKEGVTPSEITLVCILQACSSSGILKVCKEIHDSLVSTNRNLSPLLANTLIHAYGRCGSMADAQSVFDALPNPTVVAWTALIAGYAREGNCPASLQCYEEMQQAGTKPNSITFLSLLAACSHAGLVTHGVGYFESMIRDHGITPEIEHYGSLVDLLGRAGYFTTLQDLLLTMPMNPDISMCLCLLGACRKHGKVVLARQIFDFAIRLQPMDAAAYVVMSNIYDHAGLWEHANEVNEMMRKAGALKKPGQSWIGHEQGVHTFVVEDCKHSQKRHMYELLARVGAEVAHSHRGRKENRCSGLRSAKGHNVF